VASTLGIPVCDVDNIAVRGDASLSGLGTRGRFRNGVGFPRCAGAARMPVPCSPAFVAIPSNR